MFCYCISEKRFHIVAPALSASKKFLQELKVETQEERY